MEIHLVHYLVDSMLLKCQFFQNWSIDSMDLQSKPQEAFFFFGRNWQAHLKTHREIQST